MSKGTWINDLNLCDSAIKVELPWAIRSLVSMPMKPADNVFSWIETIKKFAASSDDSIGVLWSIKGGFTKMRALMC